jgi:hypothetical protein
LLNRAIDCAGVHFHAVLIAIICNVLQFVLLGLMGVLVGTHPKAVQDHKRAFIGVFVAASALVCTLASVVTYRQNKDTEEILGNQRGGKTFAYIWLDANRVQSNGGTVSIAAWLIRDGVYPLYNLSYEVLNMDHQEARSPQINVPEMSGGGSEHNALLVGALPIQTLEGYDRVFFSARNGVWFEDIVWKTSPKTGRPVFALRAVGQSVKVWGDHFPVLFDDTKAYEEDFGKPIWRE